MGKGKKEKKQNKRARKKRWLVPVICLIFLGLAASVWYGLKSGISEEKPTTMSMIKAMETPDFDRLLGRWVRPDGGYVIEIRNIRPDGRAEAAYFNPRPIQVSKAKASRSGGVIELFIELQGKGYPGSTYSLKYNPDHNALVGVYYQAAMKQSFDVVFEKK